MNSKYIKLIIIIISLTFSQILLGQNHSFTDKYNLDFSLSNSKSFSWTLPQKNYYVVKLDSSQSIHGKIPLCISQFKLGNSVARLRGGTLQQMIMLPETSSDSIVVHINCKSKNLLQAQLIISGLSAIEDILYSDTLSLLGSEKWTNFSKSLPLNNLRSIFFKIKAEGTKEVSEQRLWLDKIELTINGKDINDIPLPSNPDVPDLRRSEIISLSMNDSHAYSKIGDLGTKKVVAIGEAIHGSETLTHVAVQIIKHQVEFNHCKLVLLEMPMEMTLGWNRFIRGDTIFTIEHIIQDIRLLHCAHKEIMDLCLWLKKYNEKENETEKVWLMGMDLNPSIANTELQLFNFIYRVNERKHNKLLDSLCLQLYNYESFPQALQLMTRNREVEKLLNRNEFEILKHCLSKSIDCGNNNFRRFMIRDSLMYLNSTFLLNLLTPLEKKAVIYSHFGHVNYKISEPSDPYRYSFGSYMRSKFGNDYYTIGLFAGKGTIMTSELDTFLVKRTLKTPLVNSFENLTIRLNEEFCFIPSTAFPDQLVYCHQIGTNVQENQFTVINPKVRMDAAIFLQNSRAFDLLQGTPISNKEFNDYESKRRLDRFKQYKQLKESME